MGEQVESFGREPDPEQVEEPKVPVPVIPVALAAKWDPESLKAIGDQVREVVAQAVMEGLAEGARRAERLPGRPDLEQTMQVRYRYNPQPEVNEQDAFAYQKYAEGLDRQYPDWYKDPQVFMHPKLADEANKRLARVQRAHAERV